VLNSVKGNGMNLWSAILVVVLGASIFLAASSAEARRLGGGASFGRQSPQVAQRQALPAKPATTATAAQTPRRPFGALLGGLAAGLGLAWLASSLGLSGVLGQALVFGLLALVVMLVFGFVLRRLKGGDGRAQSAYAGQGVESATFPSSYSPDKVGNDASARPWERGNAAFEANNVAPAAAGSMIGSALGGSQSWGVPAGFDSDGFLKACKTNFVTLQAAWDNSDVNSLRAMMTDDMLVQITTQLTDRESHTGGVTNKTDVVMLDAQLLGIEELDDVYMASVEFSGMIREDVSAGASPFREVWNMTKPRTGGGWLVAGVQALQ
jgi:predicted lipid-binding transport protein (Tim44 family)